MQQVWQSRKRREIESLRCAGGQSPVMDVVAIHENEVELRALLAFKTQTLVIDSGQVALAGPVLVGLRYIHEFLSVAPHPLEIATIVQPDGIYHPNAAPNGAICLGHVPAGFTCESVLHLLWAGLNLNMGVVNLAHGEVINRDAAEFVRSRLNDFPISARGLFEEPDPSQEVKTMALRQ